METRNSIRYLKTLLSFIDDDFAMTRKIIAASGVEQLKTHLVPSAYLQEIILELQQHDIIAQRIQHLIDSIVLAPAYFLEEKCLQSFCLLQSLHLLSIGHDLDRTVSNVNRLAALLNDNHRSLKGSPTSLFVNHVEVNLVLELANENILAIGKQHDVLDRTPLSEAQVNFCLNFYTTSSERIILRLFQADVAVGNAVEFLAAYQVEIEKINHDAVQLF
jgi:hypothetical protein